MPIVSGPKYPIVSLEFQPATREIVSGGRARSFNSGEAGEEVGGHHELPASEEVSL
jgi:hypothetical protein